MKKTIKKLAMVTLTFMLILPLLTSCSSEEEEATIDTTTEAQQITEELEQAPNTVELGGQDRRFPINITDGNDVVMSVEVLKVNGNSIDLRFRGFPNNRRNFNVTSNRRELEGLARFTNLLALGERGRRAAPLLSVTSRSRQTMIVDLRVDEFTLLRSSNRPGVSVEDIRIFFPGRLPNVGIYDLQANYDLILDGSATTECDQCCELSGRQRDICQRTCIGTAVDCNISNPRFIPPTRVRAPYSVRFSARR